MDLPFSHSAAKWENVLTMSANHGSDSQCLFPTDGQYTMSQSISVMFWHNSVFSVSSSIPLDITFFNFIVETLNYTNIMLCID